MANGRCREEVGSRAELKAWSILRGVQAAGAGLEVLAIEAGMCVRKTVTKDLVFLCCGPNAGPTKVEGAREKGAFIMFDESFLGMLETGELVE